MVRITTYYRRSQLGWCYPGRNWCHSHHTHGRSCYSCRKNLCRLHFSGSSIACDFGDKTALVTTAGGATSTVSHDYGINGARSGPGRYNVTVRVIDAPTQCVTAANCYTPGATGAARDSLGLAIVNVQPSHQFSNLGLVEIGPQPSFTFNPASPTAGSPVTFNATSSRYPDEPILKNATPAAGTALTGTAGGDAACTPTLLAPCPVGFLDNNTDSHIDTVVGTIVP